MQNPKRQPTVPSIIRPSALGSYLLLAPLSAFLLVFFAIPIALMLMLSVTNNEVRQTMPGFTSMARDWDGAMPPPVDIAQAVVTDLETAAGNRSIGRIANRLNYEQTGLRTMVIKTGNRLLADNPNDLQSHDPMVKLMAADPRWGEKETWTILHRATWPVTPWYLLQSLDLSLDAKNVVVRAPAEERVYISVIGRTLLITCVVTILCLLIGYPTAAIIATASPKVQNYLLLLLLVPMWTSLLVRTTSWIVLLQDQGLVNKLLSALGLISQPLQMAHSRFAVYVAMVHILMPVIVLPILANMKRVDRSLVPAARSLGAPPIRAFFDVFLPQTIPGVVAGSTIVFILALGYYITPALVGGAGDQMVSYFIAEHVTSGLNWGMAGALSVIMLAIVVFMAAVFWRFTDRPGTGAH